MTVILMKYINLYNSIALKGSEELVLSFATTTYYKYCVGKLFYLLCLVSQMMYIL